MHEDLNPSLETLAKQAADHAAIRSITDTFRLLGVDITEMDDLNDMRDDFRFLRRQREALEVRRTEASKSLVTAVVGGVVGMIISALTWLATIARHPQ